MKIGVPKESKDNEYRVALTTQGVGELIHHGHEVHVEKNAGQHIGQRDEDYQRLGAVIEPTQQALYQASDIIVKVKEPYKEELDYIKEEQIIFSYLHLAIQPEMTQRLLHKRVTGIAFESVTGDKHPFPLLFPMSEIAGRLSIQVGAAYLEKTRSGRGVLLGGATGSAPATVMILGGGSSGTAAAQIALGMGAHVVIFEKNLDRVRELNQILSGHYTVLYPLQEALETTIRQADLVVGTVLLPGGLAPKIISRNMVKMMQPATVIVDIAIDQGGCIETSRPTTHSHPVYTEEGVIHYCVTNMPGIVPVTASRALEHSILDHLLTLAGADIRSVLHTHPHLRNGLNVYQGHITHAAVATAVKGTWKDPLALLA